MAGVKSTKKEMQERIEQILLIFRAGFKSLSDVKELFEERGWDLSEAQIRRYFEKAKKAYLQEFFDFFGSAKEMKINNLIELVDIQRADAVDKDYSLQLAIIKEKNRLLNLYEVEVFEEEKRKVKKTHASNLEELEKRILNEDI